MMYCGQGCIPNAGMIFCTECRGYYTPIDTYNGCHGCGLYRWFERLMGLSQSKEIVLYNKPNNEKEEIKQITNFYSKNSPFLLSWNKLNDCC